MVFVCDARDIYEWVDHTHRLTKASKHKHRHTHTHTRLTIKLFQSRLLQPTNVGYETTKTEYTISVLTNLDRDIKPADHLPIMQLPVASPNDNKVLIYAPRD